MDEFYLTVATFCFTLLGLWWAVVQSRFEEWRSSQFAQRRRSATTIHYAFLIPGAMSLAASIGGEQHPLWRFAFVIASVFGVLAALQAIPLYPALQWRLGQGVLALLYAVIALGAAVPDWVATPLGMSALEFEALILGLIIVLGSQMAWTMLVATEAG